MFPAFAETAEENEVALRLLGEAIETNPGYPTANALAAWEKVDSVLGIGSKSGGEAPPEILALAEERTAAKKARDFKRADAIREELKAKGWVIEDTPKGIKLKKL